MPDVKLPLNEFDKARELFFAAKKIVIISHKNPDPDSVGANLALRFQLEAIGKQVISACADLIPENCYFLKKADTFVQDFNPADFDLIVSVDCGSHDLLKFHLTKPELLDRNKTTLINIDHHPSNDYFGNVNIVMDQAPATCFILFLMFAYYGWKISEDMASALLHGLYYDTGSFMHSNTSADTLRIAARLVASGANHKRMIKEQFHSNTIPQLKLWGRALSRATINKRNAVVTALTSQDYEQAMAEPDDVSGLINYLNHVPEARFCLLLTEDKKGNIKGSLRTLRENVDLSRIALLFGGGGHKKAAGFTIPGRLKPKIGWEIEKV